ncbi:hypothetical protein Tco_1394690 [Tanacetum coccineum]
MSSQSRRRGRGRGRGAVTRLSNITLPPEPSCGPLSGIVPFIKKQRKLLKDGTYMDLFNLISAPNPTKVKTGTRPRAAHEVPLLTANANRVIDMEDTVAASRSSETPSVVEKSPLDFSSEDPPPMITSRGETEDQVPAVVSQEAPSAENAATTEVVPELNLEKEATAMGPLNTRGGKSLAAMGLGADPPSYTSATKDTPAALQSVRDPVPLSYVKPQPIPEQDIAQSSKKAAVAEDPDSEKSTSFTSMGGSPGSIYQPGWGVTNNCRLDTPDVCQDMVDHIVPPGFEQETKLLKKAVAQVARRDQRIQAREKDIKNLEAMLEAEAGMKEAAEAKYAELVKELESLCSSHRRGKEKAAFKEFKKYEDDQVNSRCAEKDARLDALSIDFNEELYPHMLTAIAGRRWVIRHGLCLAVMKCVESMELRQAFSDVVSARIAKGMSEGLKHVVEHGKAKLDLAAIEAYDPEADTKYVAALHALKDLSSSQLKIPVYPEVRNPKDPWSVKEEILLEDAIAANISRAEKKKKCQVVCRTHGVGSAHHSDGVPISVPTAAPQGLAILLADAAT